MKICPKCNEEHEKPGTFCCRSCANSREWGQEQRDKKSATLKQWSATQSREYLSNRAVRGVSKRTQLARQHLLTADFSKLGHSAIRRRVLIEQNNACNKCGIVEWLGNPIPLELDHIDGNNKNNIRTNLECLCPNCHAQTPTWRGRNRKHLCS